jgi:hypothetical protein
MRSLYFGPVAAGGLRRAGAAVAAGTAGAAVAAVAAVAIGRGLGAVFGAGFDTAVGAAAFFGSGLGSSTRLVSMTG